MMGFIRKQTGRVTYRFVLGLFALLIAVIGIVNYVILKDISHFTLPETPAFVVLSRILPYRLLPKRPTVSAGQVLRKERLDPGRKFSQSVVTMGNQEIARFKTRGRKNLEEKIYDVTGRIPNGRLEFVNETEGTHGYEYFRNGVRHGPYREYYDENDQLRWEIEYLYGDIVTLKEYYIDGRLRMEVNYGEAMAYVDGPENGSGKIYFRDGMIMYEWNLTNSARFRFAKAYNYKGKLIEVRYYDENGFLVKKTQY